jgi:hypothetical protein
MNPAIQEKAPVIYNPSKLYSQWLILYYNAFDFRHG